MSVSQSGKHVFSELHGLDEPILRDQAFLGVLFQSALQASGFMILEKVFYSFPTHGKGITGAYLLQESHATFHTYPEWCSMSVDIFSCGTPDPCEAFRIICERLRPDSVVASVVTRSFQSPLVSHDIRGLGAHCDAEL